MKTKKLVAVALMLSASYISVTGQNGNVVTEEKSTAFHLEIPDDPKLTQADIEMLMEAAKGAPAKAEPVKDDRAPALSEEQVKAEGVYYLAPANAEPVDVEAEQRRERELLTSDAGNLQTGASESVIITQELPEKTVGVTNYREISGPQDQAPGQQPTVPNTGYPKGNSEQPPGEKTPD